MILIGVFIGLLILGVMIYLALSKRSKFSTRIASLIALGIMIVTVLVCLWLIFFGGPAAIDESVVILTGSQMEAPRDNTNFIAVILLFIVLLGLFIAVFILSLRENRKNSSKVQKKDIDGLFINKA